MTIEGLLKASKSKGISKKELRKKVQERYKGCVRDSDFFSLMGLINITGIKPHIEEEFVQKKYKDYLQESSIIDKSYYLLKVFGKEDPLHPAVANLWRLMDITKIKLKPQLENEVQKAYENYVRTADTRSLQKLMEITHIEPRFTKKRPVQKTYRALIKGEKGEDLKDLKELVGITKIKPAANWVLSIYRSYVKEGCISNFERLQKISKIEPDLSTEIVQNGYRRCVIGGWPGSFKRLKELTGIKPSKKVVQDGYKTYLSIGRMSSLKEMIETSGIRPSKSTIQERYKIYISSGGERLSEFEKLKKITGIIPTKKIAQEGYEVFLNKKELFSFARLMHISGIQPSKRTYDKFLNFLYNGTKS